MMCVFVCFVGGIVDVVLFFVGGFVMWIIGMMWDVDGDLFVVVSGYCDLNGFQIYCYVLWVMVLIFEQWLDIFVVLFVYFMWCFCVVI